MRLRSLLAAASALALLASAPAAFAGPGDTNQNFFGSVTVPVQNAQYVAGNCMGGFQAIQVSSVGGTSGILNKITLISKGGLLTTKQIYVFTSNPGSSTCTDKGTFSIAAADAGKWIATLSLTPLVPAGGAMSEAEASGLGDHFVTNGNADLYFAIIETATETPNANDLVLNVGGIKDAP